MTAEFMVRTSERPDLVPVVARWLWEAFWPDDILLSHVESLVANSMAETGCQQTFVLLADGAPAGTASLVEHDLDERPDLSPWLAGVYVTPAMRGRGYSRRLIAAVEDAARRAAIRILWLYTVTAEPLYASAGWQTVSIFERHGKRAALMQRKLDGPGYGRTAGLSMGSPLARAAK